MCKRYKTSLLLDGVIPNHTVYRQHPKAEPLVTFGGEPVRLLVGEESLSDADHTVFLDTLHGVQAKTIAVVDSNGESNNRGTFVLETGLHRATPTLCVSVNRRAMRSLRLEDNDGTNLEEAFARTAEEAMRPAAVLDTHVSLADLIPDVQPQEPDEQTTKDVQEKIDELFVKNEELLLQLDDASPNKDILKEEQAIPKQEQAIPKQEEQVIPKHEQVIPKHEDELLKEESETDNPDARPEYMLELYSYAIDTAVQLDLDRAIAFEMQQSENYGMTWSLAEAVGLSPPPLYGIMRQPLSDNDAFHRVPDEDSDDDSMPSLANSDSDDTDFDSSDNPVSAQPKEDEVSRLAGSGNDSC